MDDTLLTAISTVGFPIVACIVMWKQNSELQSILKSVSETMVSITERLSQIEDKLDDKDTFSSIMATITDRLTKIENRLDG